MDKGGEDEKKEKPIPSRKYSHVHKHFFRSQYDNNRRFN